MIRSKTLMANLRRSSKKDHVVVARSKQPNNHHHHQACKKHPKHRQSPGVCSLCLRQKLSQLSANYSSSTNTRISSSCSSSLSSYCSSSSGSSSYSSSPMHRYGRFTNELINGRNVLTKSRSVACVSGKNKTGFFSKLFHPARVH